MKSIKVTRNRWVLWSVVALLLVSTLALSTAVAGRPTRGAVAPAAPAAPEGYDDSYLEVGVEWVEDYSTLGWSNLPATEPDALGLKNQLTSCGWTSRFAWGNNAAWEQDWKGYYKSGGGTEHLYVDAVDLAYFAGHGGSSGFYFNSSVDDHQLHYNDCYMDWGDGDAEWIGIAACNVLADSHKLDWVWCMDGLHLIMGFTTTMADVPHGLWFGWYLCHGYNMTQAWFRAADGLQPSGKQARVIAEQSYQFYDKWYNHTSSDPWDYYYHWWDHTVGSEPPRYVDIAQLGEMPVFETPALSTGEADNQWAQLGQAFGVTVTPRVRLDSASQEAPIWTSDDGQLEMDYNSGLYAYTELDSLWAEPVSATRSVATRLLSQEDAQAIAEQFLNGNDLMPADAQFYEVTADVMTMAEVPSTTMGLAAEQIVQSETTAYQVIYSRILTYTPPATLTHGVAQELEFSVMGPGAKLKVYVAPEATVGLSAAELAAEAVIGGMGGWRGVSSAQRQGLAVQETVPVLTYEQIEALFDELEPVVALSYVPLAFESRQVLSHTVAYYEHPIGTGQDQLIPVYVLDVEYTLAGGEVISSPAYIPANEEYMAPLAQIVTTPDPAPSNVAVGQDLVFEAVDAMTNLSDLGYDASLTFPLGSGESDYYVYNWYHDSVDAENKIGTGRTLTYTVELANEVHPGAGMVAQTIILEVTDGGSPRPPSVSYDTYQISVGAPVYLPLNLKQ
jgi:hypothetical protein